MSTNNNSNKTTQKNGIAVWFTGLSASGKSTLTVNLHKALLNKGIPSVILDGDEVRKSLNSDLGYSDSDREENNRRAAEIARIINSPGIVALCAFISPTNRIRESIKQIIGPGKFKLVYVDTPLEICEKRDKKSLYLKARGGKVKDFSGISQLFEKPSNPDIVLNGLKSVDENIVELLAKLNL